MTKTPFAIAALVGLTLAGNAWAQSHTPASASSPTKTTDTFAEEEFKSTEMDHKNVDLKNAKVLNGATATTSQIQPQTTPLVPNGMQQPATDMYNEDHTDHEDAASDFMVEFEPAPVDGAHTEPVFK